MYTRLVNHQFINSESEVLTSAQVLLWKSYVLSNYPSGGVGFRNPADSLRHPVCPTLDATPRHLTFNATLLWLHLAADCPGV